MNLRSILAILVVVGYVGFEVNALRMVRYRFEPLYTLDRFASMHHATVRCGDPEPDVRERFRLNFAAVRTRAEREIAADPEQPSPEEVQRLLTERIRAREREIDALIESEGCEGPEMWRQLKRYEQRARLNVRAR